MREMNTGDLIISHKKDAEKAWKRLTVLLAKVSDLERENDHLRRQFDSLQESKDAVDDLDLAKQKEKQLCTQLNDALANLHLAANKVQTLESQITQIKSKLIASEEQLRQTNERNDELENDNETLQQIRLQFTQFKNNHRDCQMKEKPSRKPEEKHVEELLTITEKLQTQLQSMKSLTESFNELSPRSQNTVIQEPNYEIEEAVADFEKMKLQLEKQMTEYGELQMQFEKEKRLWKNELRQAKDAARVERINHRDERNKLENDLSLMTTAVNKEQEFKEIMAKRHRTVLADQRDLINRLSEQEEKLQEWSHQLVLSQIQIRDLEKDNKTLNQIIDELNQRQNELNKIIRDLQADKQKMELYKAVSTMYPGSTQAVAFGTPSLMDTSSSQSSTTK